MHFIDKIVTLKPANKLIDENRDVNKQTIDAIHHKQFIIEPTQVILPTDFGVY